jgi:hypothetical protein
LFIISSRNTKIFVKGGAYSNPHQILLYQIPVPIASKKKITLSPKNYSIFNERDRPPGLIPPLFQAISQNEAKNQVLRGQNSGYVLLLFEGGL